MQTLSTKIEHSYFVLCEAEADANTFAALRKHNDLPDIFHFEWPARNKQGYGKYDFYKVLLGLEPRVREKGLQGIILLQDTDNSPADALKDLKEQLRKVNKEQEKLGDSADIIFTEPDDFLSPSVGGKYPILFASVPFDKPGCLETLILPAVEKAYPQHGNCLNAYEACCNINTWSVAKRDKMRLACLVATICEKDPTCSVGSMWSKSEFKHLLADEESFGEIIDFFKNIKQTMIPKKVCPNSFESLSSLSNDCA